MAHVKFIGKGKVDGREYDRGNTLDVDEATKSRLLKEGCIEGGSDDTELKQALEDAKDKIESLEKEKTILQSELDTSKGQLQTSKDEAQKEVTELKQALEDATKNIEVISDHQNLLTELYEAKKIADYEAIKAKYKKAE